MNKKWINKLLLSFVLIIAGSIFAVGAVRVLADSDSKKAAKAEKIPLYTTTSEQSTADYGSFSNAPGTEGIKVTLVDQDEFIYNKTIDLRTHTSQDPLIELCVVPTAMGEQDFSALQVILTDIYDEKNQVVIDVHDSTGGDVMSYVSAAATGQSLTGKENGVTIWQSEEYGQWCFMSFGGLTSAHTATIDDNLFCLAYDYEEAAVNLYGHGQPQVFADFDSSEYFKNLWTGFTTGEVRLSIKCKNYVKSSANFVIKKISDHELQQEFFEDSEAPVISIDRKEYTEELPVAVVGKEYPIFSSYAMDNFDGVLSTKVRIFRNYYMNTKVKVSTDGSRFIPAAADTYYLEYTAVDSSGNEGVEIVKVQTVEATDPITISFSGGTETGMTGHKISLPSYTAEGGSGTLTIKETVICDGKEWTIDNGTFLPRKAGEYVYAVTATDYVGQSTTQNFSIQINNSEEPVFIETPIIAKYYISGKTYNLPEVTAYDYSKGEETSIKTKIYAEISGKETEVTDGFTPESTGIITIKYKANNGKKETEISYTAKVINVKNQDNQLLMQNYFDMDNMQMHTFDTYSELSVNKGTGNAWFVMPIAMFDSNIEFLAKKENANFKKVNFYLYSCNDMSKYLKFTYEHIGDGDILFYLNDDTDTGKQLGFKFDGTIGLLRINREKQTVYPDAMNSEVAYTLLNYYDGSPISFDLVDSLAYLKIEIEGGAGTSVIQLNSIAGQIISNGTKDLQAPVIYIQENQLGDFKVNSEYEIKPALVLDVLDSNIESYFSVYDTNGEIVTDKNDLLLDKVSPGEAYTISLSEYGTYRVVYYAADTAGNINNSSGLILRVVDEKKPEITVNGKVVSEATVGEAFYIPSMEAEDDSGEVVEQHTHVITSAGICYEIQGDGFRPAATGKYIVRYTAVDGSGNMALKQYIVNVSNNDKK